MTRSASPTSPRKLILNLMRAAEGVPLTAADAVRACGVLGIRENSVRVTLARLSAQGLLASSARGAYELGPGARHIAQALASWRHAEDQVRPWAGNWIMVSTASMGRSDRTALRQRERALALLGLRDLEGGLHVRPDNLAGGASAIRERLRQLDLPAEIPVFAAMDFDPALEARARALWDGKALDAAYARTQRALKAWLARAHELPLEVAARECYLLGDDAIRQLVYDPLLPEPLVDTAQRHAFTQTVVAFEDAGRQIWREFLPGLRSETCGAHTLALA